MARCIDCGRADGSSRRVADHILKNCRKRRGRNCYACQKLADVERKIESARKALRILLDERDGMAVTLNERHDPFANRLPVELVSAIFLGCQPDIPLDHTSNSSYNYQPLTNATLAPGRVCRNWRTIAQGTPKLWSVVCANIDPDNCDLASVFIAEWLERSGSTSLRVQLAVQDGDSDDSSDNDSDDHENEEVKKVDFFRKAQEAVTPFFIHAHRCEVLNLAMFAPFARWMSKEMSSQVMDRLQHLELFIIFPDVDVDALHFNASPRALTSRTAQFGKLSVHWGNLTHVFMEVLSVNDCRDLFRRAPLLSFCEIVQVEGNTEATALSPVNGPSLRTLVIREFEACFWTHFTFPLLDTLSLSSLYEDNEHGAYTELLQFIRRSGCKLKTLSLIDNFQPPMGRLCEILALSPALESLTLRAARWMSSDLKIINQIMFPREPDNSTFDFLSGIKVFTIILEEVSIDWSAVVEFLTNIKKSLRTVKFQYKTPLTRSRGYATETGKEMFIRLMDVTQGLEFIFVDHNGRDLLTMLRREYQL